MPSEGIGPERVPDDACDHRDAEHRGDEVRGHRVGEPLDRRSRSLRLLDHPYDLEQRRFGPDPSRPEREAAHGVHGPGIDSRAQLLLHGDALAGQHALVDGRMARNDLAVDGDALARSDDNEVVADDVRSRDLGLPAIAEDARRTGLEPDERSDGVGRLPSCARFEEAAEEDERDDDGRCIEVGARAVPEGAVCVQQVRLAERALEECEERAVAVGHARAESDERVHVGRAALERGPSAVVERRADPELHGRGDGPEDDTQLETRQAEVAWRDPHQGKDRRAGDSRQDHLAPQRTDLFGAGEALQVSRELIVAPHLHDAQAGLLNRSAYALDARRAPDVGDADRVGAQARRGMDHAVESFHAALDILRRRSAGQPVDDERDLVGSGAIAGRLDRRHHVAHLDGDRVVRDSRCIVAQAQRGAGDAGHAPQRALHGLRTRRTRHPVDVQDDALLSALGFDCHRLSPIGWRPRRAPSTPTPPAPGGRPASLRPRMS